MTIQKGFLKKTAMLSDIGNAFMGGNLYNLLSKDNKRIAKIFGTAAGMVPGALIAGGTGKLIQAKYEDKFKANKDKSALDHYLENAGKQSALAGAVLGAALAHKRMGTLIGPISKVAALKSSVKLRPHQEEALRKLDQNNGSLLVAHATGTGKTLTGVAAFEKLKQEGKAKRALVVLPAALRKNFVDNGVKKFTNSSVSLFGPKNERTSKGIGEKSNADYNVVSYELFREHGDKLINDTGADTLIMDEVHRARGIEGKTYNRLKELRPKFKQAITLTGSVVNNQPNEVVPMLDVTFGNAKHRLATPKFFDSLFVQKDAKTRGYFNPKVTIEKRLKNKKQLKKYLGSMIDYVSHEEMTDLPDKKVELVKVKMTPEQSRLYNYTLSSVDPITRWKIRNNIPVDQKEAKGAFGKLLKARQISTDPAVMDKELLSKNPYDYSPKVKRVVDDAMAHLKEKKSNRTVIYGNLVGHQIDAVRKALDAKGVKYGEFLGMGQKGMTNKSRNQAVEDFNANKKRVLLISGAGAEGLDLKDGTMLQMVEGHYNPERNQQAEARIRRLGALKDRPKDDRHVEIKRYVAEPDKSGVIDKATNAIAKMVGMVGGNSGVDEWIYNIANAKDKLNGEFRDVLKKTAGPIKCAGAGADNYTYHIGKVYGKAIGGLPGNYLGKLVDKRSNEEVNQRIKQKLLDKGHEELTTKRHYNKILAKSKIDERALDASLGLGLVSAGIPLAMMYAPSSKAKLLKKIEKPFDKGVSKVLKMFGKSLESNAERRAIAQVAAGLTLGGAAGIVSPAALATLKNKIKKHMVGTSDLDKGIDLYTEELRRKAERKYKNSHNFINEYDTRKELGIDTALG